MRFAALALVGLVLVVPAARAEVLCGTERSAVKLGLDSEARAVRMEPADTTVGELVAIARPRRVTSRAPAELATWRIRVTITAYKLEGDGDYHVIVSDDAGHHMIVELPAPDCADRGAWSAQVSTARRSLESLLGKRPSAKLRRVEVRDVVLVGVGFFDFVHGQAGVAPNGIELHPVLGVAQDVRP